MTIIIIILLFLILCGVAPDIAAGHGLGASGGGAGEQSRVDGEGALWLLSLAWWLFVAGVVLVAVTAAGVALFG